MHVLLSYLCITVIDPTCSQPLATPGSVSPSPGPATPSSPTPGAAGVSAQVPPCGGNNAKQWTAVANGQPSSQTSQQQQRYMSREVPPRFRSQQDHKVLLKRGQPPLSSMLLGGGGEGEEGVGGNGGGSSWVATPPLSSPGTDNLIGNAAEGKGGFLSLMRFRHSLTDVFYMWSPPDFFVCARISRCSHFCLEIFLNFHSSSRLQLNCPFASTCIKP